MAKYIIGGILLLALGCAKISTDGNEVTYSRFGSQKLEGLEFSKDAQGAVKMKLGKQESSDLSKAIEALEKAIDRIPVTVP